MNKLAPCVAGWPSRTDKLDRYQGETAMLDSLEGARAGQARFENRATSVSLKLRRHVDSLDIEFIDLIQMS
jgi:hypothetical protein